MRLKISVLVVKIDYFLRHSLIFGSKAKISAGNKVTFFAAENKNIFVDFLPPEIKNLIFSGKNPTKIIFSYFR
jgi:hypothetical protein